MKEGQLTLRISKKNGKDKPKIVRQMGKADKLIKDYLEVHETVRKILNVLHRHRSIDDMIHTYTSLEGREFRKKGERTLCL